ncbi:YqaA family protein [Aliarcobacter cibarius]|jgi:membrane protein YqaA with SNARE-associated domain|uniref:DedA family protein n=1 Tax=Aliarcobacter cibarius TaxID=255507 RepID=A0A5J6RG25_9BACT|nr:YqaA family protein [Aliarcobacter cibarius]QEZ88213.1 membrane protein YqaA, SNARE-associated domain [Aliarcobacter cibarius]QKJ26009.1 membrane protein YqaA, SNARE-associated domain [Aliarcobacter cibarius]TLT00247.1 DedA family protein [Aliarcobacter cibarius]TLT00574.1 DedA family protein [Aliarcobacter cibarius]TLT05153.1 DedA family protein [Aliarcobacter cibarius]
MSYLILFISAFASATLLPLGSEALLIYNIKEGLNIYILLFVATFGNVLGSVFNYYLGLKGEEYLIEKKLVKQKYIDSSKKYFDKFGSISILFAWLPIIGDPITFIAGVLKYNFRKFLILVIISKFSRYFFIVLII